MGGKSRKISPLITHKALELPQDMASSTRRASENGIGYIPGGSIKWVLVKGMTGHKHGAHSRQPYNTSQRCIYCSGSIEAFYRRQSAHADSSDANGSGEPIRGHNFTARNFYVPSIRAGKRGIENFGGGEEMPRGGCSHFHLLLLLRKRARNSIQRRGENAAESELIRRRHAARRSVAAFRTSGRHLWNGEKLFFCKSRSSRSSVH